MRNYYCELKTTNKGRGGCDGLYVRLYVNGRLAGSCSGWGYDMVGACFGQWLSRDFLQELEKLAVKEIEGIKSSDKVHNNNGGGIYGLMVSKGQDGVRVYADGGTGIEQMFKIIKALGGEIESIKSKNGLTNKYIISFN
jgi:hypothetical protein